VYGYQKKPDHDYDHDHDHKPCQKWKTAIRRFHAPAIYREIRYDGIPAALPEADGETISILRRMVKAL
jgi:hypothetical protein